MVRIALSIEKTLFDKADALAREMGISRSRFYTLAMEQYIERRRALKRLEAAEQAAQGPPGDDNGQNERI
jgi:metal-responsive CopG/Arc/MetJ family transcriptional regulator